MRTYIHIRNTRTKMSILLIVLTPNLFKIVVEHLLRVLTTPKITGGVPLGLPPERCRVGDSRPSPTLSPTITLYLVTLVVDLKTFTTLLHSELPKRSRSSISFVNYQTLLNPITYLTQTIYDTSSDSS